MENFLCIFNMCPTRLDFGVRSLKPMPSSRWGIGRFYLSGSKCTDFARFQNVQRVLFIAKYDKGCRNCRAENHDALHKNNVNSKVLKSECSARGALLISGSWVRVPDGAPKNALHESVGRFFIALFQEGTIWCAIPSGTASCFAYGSHSARGDWSLKMAAGLWAGATIERERKRGANNVRRARRTTARAVLRSKMEALQADKRTGLNS